MGNQKSSTLFAKNLKWLRINKELSQENFASHIGISRARYKEYEISNSIPHLDIMVTIADFYKVTLDDLVRIDLEEAEKQKSKNHALSLKTLKADDQKILVVTVDAQNGEFIEFIPEKAKAGYTSGFANPLFIEALPKFRLPNIQTGTYRAFEIQGDSMPPVFDKSIVVGKYTENIASIKNLHTYILVTKEDGIVYKRVINRADTHGELILISDNPYFEPYTIAADEILEIWAYHCHIGFEGDNEYNKKLLNQLLKTTDQIR